MSQKIRVLVVDDAAFMRRSLVRLLKDEPAVEIVGEASDGREAVDCFLELRPDVVCLDIDMPRMNGLLALKHLMSLAPTPVVVVSSMTDRDDIPFEALRLGVMDFFPKPSSLSGSVAQQSRHLLYLIRNAHQVKRDRLRRIPIKPLGGAEGNGTPGEHVVVVGGSLGSVGSLIQLLSELSPTSPGRPAVVFQAPVHPVISASFCQSVHSFLGWPVAEAHGDVRLTAGSAFMVSTGLTVGFTDGLLTVAESAEGRCLDALFRNAGESFGARCTAILLAGDCRDGVEGLHDAARAGAACFVQDEGSALFSTWSPPHDDIEALAIEDVVLRVRAQLESPGGVAS